MKKIFLLFIIICCVFISSAQNYKISFTGSGVATTVESVFVENITSGLTAEVPGSDILRLTFSSGIHDIEHDQRIIIYPNPSYWKTTLAISAPIQGDAIISVYEITGKVVEQFNTTFVNSTEYFTISGLKSGLYLINVKGLSYSFSGKLLVYGNSLEKLKIEELGTISNSEKPLKNVSKSVENYFDMDFEEGDTLLFKGMSGNYATVEVIIPKADTTINFEFIPCTDGDGNNYPVVFIGDSLIWMGINLKTTKYSNGEDIVRVDTMSADSIFEQLTEGAWIYPNFDSIELVSTHGLLYHGETTIDPRNVCPAGWHVSTYKDWQYLINSECDSTLSYAFAKIKEGNSNFWVRMYTWVPPSYENRVIEGWNTTGLTCRPAGFVNSSGESYDCGPEGKSYFWTSTPAVVPELYWDYEGQNVVYGGGYHVPSGQTEYDYMMTMRLNLAHLSISSYCFSIRCVKAVE